MFPIDYLPHALPGDLADSVESTLQHIELIQHKESRLAQARMDALGQVLHRIGTEHKAGRLTQLQLTTVLNTIRKLNIAGASTLWNQSVAVDWVSLVQAAKKLPNGPEGSWVGEYPYPQNSCVPQSGFSVVYVLFDERNRPCYVGSTKSFSARLRKHWKDGKRFASWQAHPCRDRNHAYEVEDRLLKQHLPYLNKKASR